MGFTRSALPKKCMNEYLLKHVKGAGQMFSHTINHKTTPSHGTGGGGGDDCKLKNIGNIIKTVHKKDLK